MIQIGEKNIRLYSSKNILSTGLWQIVVCFCIILVNNTNGLGQSYIFNVENDGDHKDGPYYQLTEDVQGSRRGAIWCTTPINLDQPFDFTFFPNFGSREEEGADGIAFLLQTIGSSDVQNSNRGGDGRSIGYARRENFSEIGPSLAVEFDTWWNLYSNSGVLEAEDLGNDTLSYNQLKEIDHIDVIKNGLLLNNSLLPIVVPAKLFNLNPVNIEDGQCHTVRIKWTPYGVGIQNATNESLCTLEVWFDGVKRITINKDIRAIFSSGNQYSSVYWGFTSASATGYNKQYVVAYLNAGPDKIICKGGSVTLGANLSIENGITYKWTGPNGYNTTEISPTLTFNDVGVYKYTVTMSYIDSTQPNNPVEYCDVSKDVFVTVEDVNVDAGLDESICFGSKVNLKAIASSANALYEWTPNTKLSCTDCPNPVASPTQTTHYFVKVTTPTGCIDIDEVIVNVSADPGAFDATYGQKYLPENIYAADAICGAQIAGDCGYLISGMTDMKNDNSNILLIKTDPKGAKEWEKVYIRDINTPNEHYGVSHYAENIYSWDITNPDRKTLDGYAMVGQSRKNAALYDDDITIFTTDLSGNKEFSKIFGTSGYDAGYHIIQTSDKNLIVTGFVHNSQSSNSRDIFIAKLEPDLDVIWSRTYDAGGDEQAFRTIEAKDGSCLVLGFTSGFGGSKDVLVLKINPSNGTITWANTYGGNGNEEGKDIVETFDNNFVIIGNTTGFSATVQDAILFKITASGHVLWARTLDGISTKNAQPYESAYVVKEMDNEMHTLVLMVNSDARLGPGLFDPCIIKMNNLGQTIISDNAYGTDEYDYADNLNITSDNGCAFAATTRGHGHPEGEVLIVKTGLLSTGCQKNIRFIKETISLTPINRKSSIIIDTVDLEIQHTLTEVNPNITDSIVCKPRIYCEEDWDEEDNTGHKNLVDDPTFDSSICTNPIFSSDLASYCNNVTGLSSGQYTLTLDANQIHNYWLGQGHTSNSQMLVGEGPLNTDKRFWYQDVPVKEDELYTLCMYFRNICPTCPERPDVEVYLGDNLIAEQEEIDAADGWINITGSFISDTSCLTELKVIVKGSNQSSGFALDDINFIEVNSGQLSQQVTFLTNEKEDDKKILIYPNPIKVGDVLHLKYSTSKKESIHISLIDIAGKEIKHIDYPLQESENLIMISTSNLSAGIYTVRLYTVSSFITYKVTVIE